jgi:small-conductance mechanosensitive channel
VFISARIAAALYDTPWVKTAIYLAITVVAARVVDGLLARRDRAMTAMLKRAPGPSERTRFRMIRRLIWISILFVGGAIALSVLPGIGTLAHAMLASAAIFAAVAGIAARAPIANLVSGIMIAFSQPVRLGDYISIDDDYGTVEEISLIYTYISTLDNRLVAIPNEALASKAVHNYSVGSPGSMVTVTFSVPPTEPLREVRSAALEETDRLAAPPSGKVNSVIVEALAADEVTLRVDAWVIDPLKRRELAGELRAAIVRRLNHDGVYSTRDDGDDRNG